MFYTKFLLQKKLVFLFFLLQCTCYAMAADWSLSSNIEMWEQYNSNTKFVRKEYEDDWMTKIVSALGIDAVTEKGAFSVNGRAVLKDYYDQDYLDEVTGDISANYSHAWNPVFETAIMAGMQKDNTLEKEFVESGYVSTLEDRHIISSGISGRYNRSESFLIHADADLNRGVYPDKGFSDFYKWSLNLTTEKGLNLSNKVGLRIGYSGARYEGLEKTCDDNLVMLRGLPVIIVTDEKGEINICQLAGSLFWNRALSEKHNFSCGVGWRRTRTDRAPTNRYFTIKETGERVRFFDPFTGNPVNPVTGEHTEPLVPGEECTDDGLIFNASLEVKWSERFSTVLSAGSDFIFSVDARAMDKISLRASFSYRISEHLDTNMTITYNLNSQEGSDLYNDTSSHSLIISPAVRWRMSDRLNLSMRGSYDYFESESDADQYDIERYIVSVGLDWSWPRIVSNH